MTGIDYEVEYNNRARVPENPALMAGWARDAAAYREQRAPRRIAYGSGPRHVIDVFAGEGQAKERSNAPLVVFIHGGYWQALDGSWFSHMARGLNAHGITVAVPTYDLCPQVSVAEITEQMRQATGELAKLSDRLIISGHSAGGHLAACMLATDWRAYDASLPPQLVARLTRSPACSSSSHWFRLRSTRPSASIRPRPAPQARCSGSLPPTAVSMPWWARRKARNITGKAGVSSRPGARPASSPDTARFLPPITSRRLRRWRTLHLP